MACLGDATREDKRLGVDDRGIVSQTQAQHPACATIDLDGKLIALITTLRDRMGRQFLEVAHQRGLIALGHDLLRCQHDTLGSCVGLQTTLVATATQTSAIDNTGMSDLTTEAIAALVDQTIGEQTTAHTRAQGDQHEVAHTPRTAKGVFTQSRYSRIIGQCHRHTHPVAQHRSQRNHPFPGQVGRIHDTTCHKTAAGCTDTYRTDTLVAPVPFNQSKDPLTQCRYILIDVRIVLRRKTVLSNDVTFYVDYGVSSLSQANVYAYDPFLCSSLFHSSVVGKLVANINIFSCSNKSFIFFLQLFTLILHFSGDFCNFAAIKLKYSNI